MTYKLELFLVLQKKKKKRLINIKIIQKLCFLWFTYIGLLVFYTKLTHLELKKKKIRLDRTHVAKLNSNLNPIYTLN